LRSDSQQRSGEGQLRDQHHHFGVSDPKQAADRTKEVQERVSAAALSNIRGNLD
jgi:hypothetical protein